MEEKERYKLSDNIEFSVIDNLNKEFLDYKTVIDILNQQSKRIKELERKILIQLNNNADNVNFMENQRRENQKLKQQLAESETQLKEEIEEKNGVRRALSACNRQNDEFADMIKKLVNENEELKQQLHDLPKKIVCEISESIERLSWRKRIYTNWEFDKEQLYKDLDTILKKFGGGK